MSHCCYKQNIKRSDVCKKSGLNALMRVGINTHKYIYLIYIYKMDKNIQVILYGQIGSPYSMKIKSILRYKRILYIFNTTNTIMDIWSN